MDQQVIDQKLESLRRCLLRIDSKQPFDAHQLSDDFDLQDIISLNLTRAVQMAVDIGAHIAASQNRPGPPPATPRACRPKPERLTRSNRLPTRTP